MSSSNKANAGAQSPPKAPLRISRSKNPTDILLVMKEPEAAFCASALSRINPALRITWAPDLSETRAAIGRTAPGARLIGFSTSVIVPPDVLAAFPDDAYNFHPGPPEFPGNRPSAFACYARAPVFGVTFHRMLAKVDEGEILDCERFPVIGLDRAGQIAVEAYQRLARLFLRNAVALARIGQPLSGNGEIWSGRKTTQAEFDRMRQVPGDVDQDELAIRIKAFNWIYTPIGNNDLDA